MYVKNVLRKTLFGIAIITVSREGSCVGRAFSFTARDRLCLTTLLTAVFTCGK
jgi:hypothetical protein